MTPNLAAGGGIAVIGVILTALVHGAVFDITGGVLTTVGILFAGVTLGLNKSKILRRFNEEIEKGRVQLQTEVTETLNEYTTRIKERINDNFYHFDQHLLNEERKLTEMNSQSSQVQSSLNELGTHMKVYL